MFEQPIEKTVAGKLAKLEDDGFEYAVTTLHHKAIRDFQVVPRKPQGDGGLDGLSDGQTTAYCIYGLTQNSIRTKKGNELKNDICKKFRIDMMKLFELETSGKKIIKKNNSRLRNIHGRSNKIKIIILISNWFEDHGIIGNLNKALDEYLKHSDLNFIEKNCQIKIEGPSCTAKRLKPNVHFLFELEYPIIVSALSSTITKDRMKEIDRSDFDDKFDVMKGVAPKKFYQNRKTEIHAV